MANNENRITQIYDLQVVNFDLTEERLKRISDGFRKIKEEKQALNGKGSPVDAAALAEASRLLDQVLAKEKELNKTLSEGLATARLKLQGQKEEQAQTGNNTRAFALLNDQYRAAKENAQDLATEFGADSKQAREAAASAAAYKLELIEINNLIKNGGVRQTAPVVDTTNNPVGGGDVLTDEQRSQYEDLKRLEDEASNSAVAFGGNQRKAGEAVAVTAGQFDDAITPLSNYTGTLSANIRQQGAYTSQLANVGARLKALNTSYDAAGKLTDGYKNKQAALLQEERQLKIASAELNQTINAQVKYVQSASGSYDQLNAELGLSRNLMRQLSAEEKGGTFGAELSSRINFLDAGIKKTDAGLGNFQRNVGNYAKSAFGFIRQAANILPGIGIAGIFGLAFEGIAALVSKITEGSDKLNVFKDNIANLNSVMSNANKSIAEQSSTLRILYQVATDANIPLEQRRKAVDALQKQFPDYFKNINDETILNGNASKVYQQLASDIIAVSRAKAAKDKVDELEARRLDAVFAKQKIIGKTNQEIAQTADRQITVGAGVGGTGGAAIGQTTLQTKAEQENIIRRRRDISIKEQDVFINGLQQEEDFLIKYVGAGNIAKALEEKTTKTTKTVADKLSVLDKNNLNQIDALLQTQLAAEKLRFTELQKDHEATFNEEREHVARMLAINQEFIGQKINYLEQQKSLNAKEKQQLAAFRNEKAQDELDAAQKQTAINAKEFTDRNTQLKALFEEEKRAIVLRDQLNQEDVNGTAGSRAASKVAADTDLLAAQRNFNDDQNALEIELKQHSEKNAKDTAKIIADTTEQLRRDQAAQKLAILADIKETGDRETVAINTTFSKYRIAILENDKLTKAQKDKQLDLLKTSQNRTLLSAELERLTKEVEATKRLYIQGLVNNDAYLKAVEKQKEVAAKLAEPDPNKKTNIQNFLSGGIGDSGITVGEVVAKSFDLAQSAMTQYFDQEEERINQSRTLALDRLNVDEEAAKKKATSQAEIDKIDRDYEKKKDQVNKEAGEKLKKQRKAELALSLATELANIAVAAAANPLNAATFGAAGLAQFGILSGFAIARSALRLQAINAQQFEFGGKPGEVPTKGGRFGGRPHSQGGTNFSFNGERYNAEADELAIIRTKNAEGGRFSLTGTHEEIASALNRLGGGVAFRPGAKVRRLDYGGNLGESMQAPLFVGRSGSLTGGMEDVFLELVKANQVTSERIDRLQVVQETRTVGDALRKQVRQSNIGTLG